MSDETTGGGRTAAVRGLAGSVGRAVSDRVRQQLADEAGRQAAVDAVRGLAGEVGRAVAERRGPQADGAAAQSGAASVRDRVGGVQRTVTDRVRQGLGAVDPEEALRPARRAADAVSGLVGGVGQGVADLVRQEIGAARSEAAASAKAAARGAALLGGAAATGNVAVLFTGVAVWRGLGNRIGFARSALVVAALSGATTAVLATQGVGELARVKQGPPTGRRPGAAPTRGSTSGPPAPAGPRTTGPVRPGE